MNILLLTAYEYENSFSTFVSPNAILNNPVKLTAQNTEYNTTWHLNVIQGHTF